MPRKFQVSQTKINLWGRCKYAYHLRYEIKLRKRAKSRPLQFGSMAHIMVEADAEGDDVQKALNGYIKTMPKMFAAEREELLNTVADVRAIMTDYFEYWKNDPISLIRVNKRFSEHEFEVDMGDGIVIVGKIDAFGADDRNRKWMVENKTFTRLPSPDHRWRNIQSNIYLHPRVLSDLGIKDKDVAGTLWNYIHSKAPGVPQLLKSGELSRKRLNTLPTRLRAFLKEHGFKEKDYVRLIKAAEDNRKNYFLRERTSKKPRVIEAIWAEAKDVAVEIRDSGSRENRPKTIDRHCEWCDFEPICRAQLQGNDPRDIIKREFTHAEGQEARVASYD